MQGLIKSIMQAGYHVQLSFLWSKTALARMGIQEQNSKEQN